MAIYLAHDQRAPTISYTRPEKNERSIMAAQKVALVTAGTAGLGAQVARALAPDFRVVRLLLTHDH